MRKLWILAAVAFVLAVYITNHGPFVAGIG
jgi:hypothetical protein